MAVWLGTLDSHIISYLNLDIYLDMIKYIFISFCISIILHSYNSLIGHMKVIRINADISKNTIEC